MIAFVILHYQASEETMNCIKTIKERVKTEKRIVLVDNCSPNNSGVTLEKFYSLDEEVAVIRLSKNVGFAKGNNIGYREAKKHNPQYIVVMNNDAFIDCDDFENLINLAYAETRFDILGPDIYSTRDNIHQNPHRMMNFTSDELQRQYRFLKFKNRMKFLLRIKYALHLYKSNKSKENTFLDEPLSNVVLHGACYIYSENYINNHDNCLYDGTFMYYESYILHALAQRESLRLVYYPHIRILHHEDVATNNTFDKAYAKTVFTNKCLLDSCGEFINVLSKDDIRIG